MLEDRTILSFFDYVDPGSYLLHHVVRGTSLDWRAFEVRVPPEAPIGPGDPQWLAYQDDVAHFAYALDISLDPPGFVPWTRKAHELGVHGRERDCYEEVRDALFRAHFVQGLDIGRIDVLVEIARAVGLDPSETKAALDVDRYADSVLSDRAMGEERGVVGVPTLVRGRNRLEGLHSPSDTLAWIRD